MVYSWNLLAALLAPVREVLSTCGLTTPYPCTPIPKYGALGLLVAVRSPVIAVNLQLARGAPPWA